MILERSFGSFNEKRYGKPWGAVITFPDGIKPAYDFRGHWDGSSVVMKVEPGDVVAFGQRDHRGRSNRNDWFVVGPDGALTPISEADARRRANNPPAGEGDVSPGDRRDP